MIALRTIERVAPRSSRHGMQAALGFL